MKLTKKVHLIRKRSVYHWWNFRNGTLDSKTDSTNWKKKSGTADTVWFGEIKFKFEFVFINLKLSFVWNFALLFMSERRDLEPLGLSISLDFIATLWCNRIKYLSPDFVVVHIKDLLVCACSVAETMVHQLKPKFLNLPRIKS